MKKLFSLIIGLFSMEYILKKETPIHEHDCSQCKFLGNYTDKEVDKGDLYFCQQGGVVPTVIFRYGIGPDYTSGMKFAERIPSLAEAKKRATKEGLIQ